MSENEGENKDVYHFFLSELKNVEDDDLAMVIELMRSSQHIRDIMRLANRLDQVYSSESEEGELQMLEDESLITLILNISAAQLREALKIFWRFSGTDFFQIMKQELSVSESEIVEELITLNNEFDQKKGFIYEVLKPLRDCIFHYDYKEAVNWVHEMKDAELGKKPPFHSVDLEKYYFGPGEEYDKEVYTNYLFWGSGGLESIMSSQLEVWDLQQKFLEVTKIIVEHLLKREEIPIREDGWFMEFFYGYKPKD